MKLLIAFSFMLFSTITSVTAQTELLVKEEKGVLLNCTRYNGEQDFQIYINEAESYLLYNAQRYDNYKRLQVYNITDSDETTVVDMGLDITASNSAFIIANDNSSSFVLYKGNATFAYAWTSLNLVGDGKYLAFGNNHEGNCSANPFNQGQ